MLEIKNLSVKYAGSADWAVENVSINLKRGEILGIVGESGSGKTTIANSVLQLLPNDAECYGEIILNGIKLNDKNLSEFRGNTIGYISQNFFASLNNSFTIFQQFDMLYKSRQKLDKKARKNKMLKLLSRLEFPEPEQVLKKYPFQLSGGMKQRIVIAMVLANEPELVIADEPTSAIDTISKREMLKILQELNIREKVSLIIISHDLPIIRDFVDSLMVVYSGEVLEMGSKVELYDNPLHPYTKLLLGSKPDFTKNRLTEKCIYNEKHIAQIDTYCKFSAYCQQCNKTCENSPVENNTIYHYCRCCEV